MERTAYAALRTGGKEPLDIENIVELCREKLKEIADELRRRSSAHMDDVMASLPKFVSRWKLKLMGEIVDGKIYEMPFDGTDAHAEIIESKLD